MKKRPLLVLLALFPLGLFSQTLPSITWSTTAVKDPQKSAGFLDVEDFNNDGKKEIILSTLMEEGSAQSPWQAKGALRKFTMPSSGISGAWTESVLVPLTEALPFINYPQIMDVDGDGNKDILIQQGFLQTNGGSHQWLKGPDFTQRFNFASETTKGNTYYFWHESEQVDLDGDGLLDIVTTSAQSQDAATNNNNQLTTKKTKIEWYRHLGIGQFEYHLINDSLGGVFIKLHDIDKDGDKDIVVSQFFGGVARPAIVWLENVNKPGTANNWTGEWAYHVIDHTTGLGYHLEFYDLDADGEMELVYDNHNNEDNAAITMNGQKIMPGLFYFEIPADPKQSSQWQKTVIYDRFRTNLFDFNNPASQGCPGIFSIGDLDQNGLADIVVPGDGNDTLYLFRQKADHSFQMEMLDKGKMFGMAKITDLDGDGNPEVVAAKHNFPEIFELLNPPAGYLKIYKPVLSTTGLELSSMGGLMVDFYPNPMEDKLLITVKDRDSEKSTVEIFNLLGEQVKSQELFYYSDNEGINEINVADLTSGIYIATIYNSSNKISYKLVKR